MPVVKPSFTCPFPPRLVYKVLGKMCIVTAMYAKAASTKCKGFFSNLEKSHQQSLWPWGPGRVIRLAGQLVVSKSEEVGLHIGVVGH